MTVLYSPVARAVYSDEPCWPLTFADPHAIDPGAELHTLVAGLNALHYRDDGICAEDALDWPCKTVQLARIARGVQ